MSPERRLFRRTNVEVQGVVEWATKRRIGGIKQHSVATTTVDLSVNGAKLIVDHKVDLPPGASCRIGLEDSSSPARVLSVQKNERGEHLLSMELENPPPAFMQVIEQWISQRENGWQFDDSGWSGSGVVDDFFADRAS